MAVFRIHARRGSDRAIFLYDNETSGLSREDGEPIPGLANICKEPFLYTEAPRVSKNTPLGKGKTFFRLVKIQLGLSCNYACGYCLQAHQVGAAAKSVPLVQPFLDKMPSWYDGGPHGDGFATRIEFWGGEPLTYWKALKPLAEEIRARYPRATLSIITNGSLLNKARADWLIENDFIVMVSHDGPGQAVRGADPFKDPVVREAILALRLGHRRKFAINVMLNRQNTSRRAVVEWLRNEFGIDFNIGEGGLVAAYDEGGKHYATLDPETVHEFRYRSYEEIMSGDISRFSVVHNRVNNWLHGWTDHRPSHVIGQKCGMDKEYAIAVDLEGNVVTCQNVSAKTTAANGRPHKIGHVDAIKEVKLDTATHWAFRENCTKCPIVQACQGSCMFLQDELFDASCDASYNDHLPFMAAAFAKVTGYTMVKLEGPQPHERWDVFGPHTEDAINVRVCAD